MNSSDHIAIQNNKYPGGQFYHLQKFNTFQMLVPVRVRILVLFILISTQLKAIRIQGHQPAWSGHVLEFKILTDPVSQNEKDFFNLKIDSKGDFSAEIPVTEPTFIFADFGIFRGKLFIVPNENINITLPPLKEKSFEESKNPYFEPIDVWLKTSDENALSNLASRFDFRFNTLTDKYFDQLYYRNQKKYLDTIRQVLEKEFLRVKNPVFNIHKELRMQSLEADLMRADRERMAGTLKLTSVSDWNQPAFVEFFNHLFINTLSSESKTPSGKNLRQWVVQKNIPELARWSMDFTASSPPLSDLILLKMLHDAFYSGEFSKTAILQMLRADYFGLNPCEQIRKTSGEVIKKLSFMLPGSPAPVICLPGLNGTTYCTDTDKTSYKYILFADLEIPVCREQVKYLKTLIQKTGPSLQVLLVLVPSSRINAEEFISAAQIPGMVVLDDAGKSTGKKYKVRSYPSAFLLSKDHKVVLSPAKTPLDGFEYQFAAYKK